MALPLLFGAPAMALHGLNMGAGAMGMGQQGLSDMGPSNVVTNMGVLADQYNFRDLQSGWGSGIYHSGFFGASRTAPETMRQLEYSRNMQELAARSRYYVDQQWTGTNFFRTATSIVGLNNILEPIFSPFDYKHRSQYEGALRMSNVFDNVITRQGFRREGGGAEGSLEISDRYMQNIVDRSIRSWGPLQFNRRGISSPEEMVDLAQELANRSEFSTLTANLDSSRDNKDIIADRAAQRTLAGDEHTRRVTSYFGERDRGAALTLVRELVGMTSELEEIDPMQMERAAAKVSAFAKAAGQSISDMAEIMKQGAQMGEQMGVGALQGSRILGHSFANVNQMVGEGILNRGHLAQAGGIENYAYSRAQIYMGLGQDRSVQELRLARIGGMDNLGDVRSLDQETSDLERPLIENLEKGRPAFLDPRKFTKSLANRAGDFYSNESVFRRTQEAQNVLHQETAQKYMDLLNYRDYSDVSLEDIQDQLVFDAPKSRGEVQRLEADDIWNIVKDKAQKLDEKDRTWGEYFWGMGSRALSGTGMFFNHVEWWNVGREHETRQEAIQNDFTFTGSRAVKEMVPVAQEIGDSRVRMNQFMEQYSSVLDEMDPGGTEAAVGSMIRGLAERAAHYAPDSQLDQNRYFRRLLSRRLGHDVDLGTSEIIRLEALNREVTNKALREIMDEESFAMNRVQTFNERTETATDTVMQRKYEEMLEKALEDENYDPTEHIKQLRESENRIRQANRAARRTYSELNDEEKASRLRDTGEGEDERARNRIRRKREYVEREHQVRRDRGEEIDPEEAIRSRHEIGVMSIEHAYSESEVDRRINQFVRDNLDRADYTGGFGPQIREEDELTIRQEVEEEKRQQLARLQRARDRDLERIAERSSSEERLEDDRITESERSEGQDEVRITSNNDSTTDRSTVTWLRQVSEDVQTVNKVLQAGIPVRHQDATFPEPDIARA